MNEVYADSGLGKWFGSGGKGGAGGGGWDRYNTKGERIGKCGDKSKGEGKPKCLSKQKAARMSKKQRANAVKRKRKKDPSTDRPGTGNKPINVSNRINKEHTMLSFSKFIAEKNVPTDPSKWAASKAAAKAKFDVYPSAYANAWASKNYKSKGGGWKKANESVLDEQKKNCGCGKDPCITYGKKNEALDHEDKPVLKKIIKKLKGASQAHAGQAKDLEKAMSEGAAWTKKAGQNKEGGLNEKGRKSYERDNPGSDLKAPSKKKGNKRRASFCARMKGMRKRQKPSNNTGDDRLSKSLRAWNC